MTHENGRDNQANAGRPGGPFRVHDGGQSAPAHGMSVLLIDADVEFRDRLSAALDRFGMGVLWRARILGLLEAVAHSEPTAVILSADLPAGDPLELIRAIRQQPSWGRLPVFLVGTEIARPLELRAYAEGADAVLQRDTATAEVVARLLGRSTIETRKRNGTAKSIADAALALCATAPQDAALPTTAPVESRTTDPVGSAAEPPPPNHTAPLSPIAPHGPPGPHPQPGPHGYPMYPGYAMPQPVLYGHVPQYIYPPQPHMVMAPYPPAGPHGQPPAAHPGQPPAGPSTQPPTPPAQPLHTAAHAPPNAQFTPPEGYGAPPAEGPDASAGLGAEYRGAPPPAPGQPDGLSPASAASVPDVIVVEDDPSLLEMLRYALTNRGFSTLSFSNGLDALRAMREMDTVGRHPVVLLDVDLPGLDGFRILHELSGARPGLFQVILCTVHSSEATQVLGIQSGAIDYLVKPLRMPIVLAKVERLLGRGAMSSAAGG